MGLHEGFFFGAIGGVLVEVLGLFKLRREDPDRLPTWLKSKFYWIVTIMVIILGGVLVVIYLISDFMLNLRPGWIGRWNTRQPKRLLVEGQLVSEAISSSQASYRFGVTRRRNNPNYDDIPQSTLRF